MHDHQKEVAAIQTIEAVPSILQVLCETTGMGFAAVARVTESRWIACEVLDLMEFGLQPGSELPVETTICRDSRALCTDVVIDDVASDPIYSNHPAPRMYGFQSYISVPIVLPGGEVFGTLCAIHPEPITLSGTSKVGMFRLFAQLIAFHLTANQALIDIRANLEGSKADLAVSQLDLASSQANLAESQADLLDAQTGSELREQFVAVLGHDLRNPLAAIDAGRGMLARLHEDPKSTRILRLMGESVSRMAGLIDNVLDFARGRLGDGIAIDLSQDQRIEPLLAQIINEIKSAHPEREILSRFELAETVDVDHARLAQLVSNLLGNAITHGAPNQPIVVEALIVDQQLELSVINGGDAISAATMERLFQPFQRGQTRPSLQGLGLGLYIASQIAKAHGGTLSATSTGTETRFTFRMPVRQA